MDIEKLTQQNILDPNEVLVSKFASSDNTGIGIKQFVPYNSEWTPETYATETMKLVMEVVKEVELQNLTVNNIGIQLLKDTLTSLFKTVVLENGHGLVVGGTISRRHDPEYSKGMYDHFLTFNFMFTEEKTDGDMRIDLLQTVNILTIPLNLMGGINDFGDNMTFDTLFKSVN